MNEMNLEHFKFPNQTEIPINLSTKFHINSALVRFRNEMLSILNSQVIAAEGEQKASRALRQASDVIVESAAALQLRYLQVYSYTRNIEQPINCHNNFRL